MHKQMGIRDRIGNTFTLLTGMAMGAGLYYIFDPQRGAQRRAIARDKAARGVRMLARYADKQSRNAMNHLRGSMMEVRSSLRDRFVDDQVLRERVRAQLGHVVSHPGSIEVQVEGGRVVVSGPILEGEREKIACRLEETRGVKDYEIHVREHRSSGNVPGLQGESRWQREQRVG